MEASLTAIKSLYALEKIRRMIWNNRLVVLEVKILGVKSQGYVCYFFGEKQI